jgi:hypothetical protein
VVRLARVIAVGVAHHVTQRGNGRRSLLDSNTDRRIYLELLGVPSENGQLSTLGMLRCTEGPESALCEPGALPLVVSGEG